VSNEDKILAALEGLQGQMGAMQGQMGSMQGQMTSMQKDITSMQEDITSIKGDITSIDIRLTSVEGQMTSVEGQMTSMKSDIKRISGSVAFIEIEHGKKIGALLDYFPIIVETNREVKDLRNVVDKLKLSDDVIRIVNSTEARKSS
jgi:peptidoglycan hydrolase CwlO-like protein